MNEILNAIQKNIDTNLPAVKYIDENWGQLDIYGPEIPVKWPCVLIDLNQAPQFSNTGKKMNLLPVNRQQGTVVVELTVAALKLTNSSFKAPPTQKWHGFEIWEIVNDLHKIIHGWQPAEQSGSMTRTGMSKVRRDDGVQEIRVLYSLSLYDC